MKTSKVTYITSELKQFNTIVPLVDESEVLNYIGRHYDNVTVIKVRPSVKQKYTKVCNYRVN